jgi:hypothetical protein
MPTKRVILGRWAAAAALLLVVWLGLQVAVVLAAGPEEFAMPQVESQVIPTPTPFRFLTPIPSTSTTTVTTTQTPPRAGGFPLELAIPTLAGGLAAIGGGSFLLRRKSTR